jgi:hypothetical protein
MCFTSHSEATVRPEADITCTVFISLILSQTRLFNRASTLAGRWTLDFGFFVVGSTVKVANSTGRSD